MLQDAQVSKAAFVNRTQQCFAVKAPVDGFLGLSRANFCRLTEQVHQQAEKYRVDDNLPGLKACNLPPCRVYGFFVWVSGIVLSRSESVLGHATRV